MGRKAKRVSLTPKNMPDPYLVAKAQRPLIAKQLRPKERSANGVQSEGIRVMRAMIQAFDQLIRDRSEPPKK